MLLALASAFFGAIAAILAKRLLAEVNSALLLGPNFVVIAVLMAPAAPLAFKLNASEESVGLLGAIILVDLLANLALFAAIRRGPLGTVLPVIALVPGFTIVAALGFFPNEIELGVLAGALILIGALTYLQASRASLGTEAEFGGTVATDPQRNRPRHAVYLALASSALFGLSANLTKLLLDGGDYATNPYTVYFLRAIGIGIVASVAFSVLRRRLPTVPVGRVAFRGVFVIAQWLMFLGALASNNIVAVTALANSVPLFTLIGAAVFLNEPITPRRVIAALTATVGIAIVLGFAGG